MMIPREGELFDLNMSAQYDGPGPDGEVATVTIGGHSVSVYVTYPGIFRIALNVNEGEPDPRIKTHENDEGAPLVEFAVNGNTIGTY